LLSAINSLFLCCSEEGEPGGKLDIVGSENESAEEEDYDDLKEYDFKNLPEHHCRYLEFVA
jgi:hypothetical protein